MNLCWANRLQGLALLMLLWGGQPAYAQEAAQAKPAAEVSPIVQAVRIVKQDGSVLSTNPPGLSVEVGAPLNRDQIAASIHTLYKTGDFANTRMVTLFTVTQGKESLVMQQSARQEAEICAILKSAFGK